MRKKRPENPMMQAVQAMGPAPAIRPVPAAKIGPDAEKTPLPGLVFPPAPQGKDRAARRQCALAWLPAPSWPQFRHIAAMLALLALAGCGGSKAPAEGELDSASARGFTGSVSADEPRAAIVARDVLSAGGNAADAVVAATLAMAVTYPSAVSLGAGGICVAANMNKRQVDVIDFQPLAAAAGGPIAVPGLMRGMGLLHSRYGAARWEATVAPAELLAREGAPMSRALLQAAQETRPAALGDPALANLLMTRGVPRAEGEPTAQPMLAAVLARLRVYGVNDLYTGQSAQMLLTDIQAAGGKVTLEDLQRSKAVLGKPIELPFHNGMTVYFAQNTRGSAVSAWLAEQAYQADALSIFKTGTMNMQNFVGALGQAYRGTEGNAPIFEHGTTGIAAIDKKGNAVSCAITLGRAFGTRQLGRNTGILLAAAPAAGDETPYLSVAVAGTNSVQNAFVAIAASGGAPAPAALAETLLYAVPGRDSLVQALARPRFFQAAPTAPLLYEPGADAALLNAVTARGVPAVEVRRLARVSFVYCSNGVPRTPESCRTAPDRRGFGLAIGDEF